MVDWVTIEDMSRGTAGTDSVVFFSACYRRVVLCLCVCLLLLASLFRFDRSCGRRRACRRVTMHCLHDTMIHRATRRLPTQSGRFIGRRVSKRILLAPTPAVFSKVLVGRDSSIAFPSIDRFHHHLRYSCNQETTTKSSSVTQTHTTNE